MPFFGIECRLCLNQMYNMRNVILNPVSTDFELSIPELINILFDIKIDRNDNYSKVVCANCLSVIQLIEIQRRRFKNCQKDLKTIIKHEESLEKVQKDGEPPILAPFFENCSMKQENNHKTNNSVKDQVGKPCHCSKANYSNADYVRVPIKYFEESKRPRIQIKYAERNLANLALYGHNHSKLRKRHKNFKRNYLLRVYNKDRPGAIRELIQDHVRRTIYQSDFDTDNRLKSIYEYDCNMNPRNDSEFNKLWEVGMQLSVFVCSLCSKVFYKKNQLESHQRVHEKYKAKLDVFKVIF